MRYLYFDDKINKNYQIEIDLVKENLEKKKIN